MKPGTGSHVIVDLHGASNLDCERSVRDAIEGLTAFIEKRKPQWQNR
ncbi:MAG: hypothetical protein AAEJ43_12115 [Gammaproteobacteria bacterium]